jgi:D-glycero-alpha-D-manno-heptose-7-phosphate kinase
MIITRTPFRISFFGGGTDFPDYFKEHEGCVLSTSINKYCYIVTRILPPFFEYNYQVRYSEFETVKDISDIKHPVVRECLRKFDLKNGIEIVHTSDIPAKSGIGSSSAFTVGMIHALNAMRGNIVTKRFLASEAIEMEQNILKENVGCQDQVACAFGGVNRIDFSDYLHFYVTPITIKQGRLAHLQNNLMLFFTGFTRFSSEIAVEQKKKIPINIKPLELMKQMVDEACKILNSPNESLEDFGKLLDENWKLKKSLSSQISNDNIDALYSKAKKTGAVGGKILGAGGGGFLLLYVPKEYQENVKEKLKNYLHVPFKFEDLGSQIIMYAPDQKYAK